VNVIMKGYGEIKLAETNEVVSGEITLYAEGWVVVAPAPPGAEGDVRWFPRERVLELVWRKSIAVQQRRV